MWEFSGPFMPVPYLLIYAGGILVGVFITGLSTRIQRWHRDSPAWLFLVALWPFAWIVLPFWGAYVLGNVIRVLAARATSDFRVWSAERDEQWRLAEEQRKREAEDARSRAAQRTAYR